jgi:hypothetical protein
MISAAILDWFELGFFSNYLISTFIFLFQAGSHPPFNSEPQDSSDLESKMDPKPDYGYTSYNSTSKLRGKIAIITGGDSGIGRAVASAFAREGATVVISYLNETEDAEEIQQAIQQEGHECICL